MSRSLAFLKKYRLQDKRRILAIFRSGFFVSAGQVKIKHLANSLGHGRIVLSFSRKAGSAPTRNLWKRKIREEFRINECLCNSSLDFAVYNHGALNKNAIKKDIDQIIRHMEAAVQRITKNGGAHAQKPGQHVKNKLQSCVVGKTCEKMQ